jgi:hypothetical protein
MYSNDLAHTGVGAGILTVAALFLTAVGFVTKRLARSK